MSTILNSQVRKTGLGKKNTLPDPPKEENRVWRCENKQPDPEIKIMSIILGSQTRKPGLRKENTLSDPLKEENRVWREKIYSQTCEAQDSIRFPSPPVSSPWLFVTRHNS